ncbi:MAG: VOC family protein [Pseudomonadota bacterium]
MASRPFVVWSEVPVRDLTAAMEFYKTVFVLDLTRADMGPNETATWGGGEGDMGGGHLYPGTPASDGNGPTVHITVPDKLEAAIDRCWSAGGKVVSEPITIPPGRFAYATDPDGNSIGLFEPTMAA